MSQLPLEYWVNGFVLAIPVIEVLGKLSAGAIIVVLAALVLSEIIGP